MPRPLRVRRARVAWLAVGTLLLAALPAADPAAADWATPAAGLAGRIAFSRDVEGLYVMNADGSDIRRVPIGGLGELTLPDWTG